MELIDPATGQTFECPQGWPTNRRRAKLSEINREHIGTVAALAKEYPKVYEISKKPLKERQLASQDDPQLAVQSTEYGEKSKAAAVRSTMRMCQASLETKNLTPERRALVESDVESDFWQEQSVPAMEEAVERFQRAYQRGQRGDQARARVEGDEPAAAEERAASVSGGEVEVGDGAGA